MDTDTGFDTDREAFADMIPSRTETFSLAFFRQMERDALTEALRFGLDAFAALWFDHHDDATRLPKSFIDLALIADDTFTGEVISDRLAATPSLS